MMYVWIIILAVTAALILLFYKGRLLNKDKPVDPRTGEPALEILKKRYVKGEITKDEFEEMKAGLKK